MEQKKNTVFDICLKVTSDFEGSTYSTITENFDGQGLSVGILQFNIGQGTLAAYILNQVDVMSYDMFPLPISSLRDKKEAALVWHKDNCCDVYGRLKPEWKKAWQEFLVKPEIINLQKTACGKYFQRAREIAGFLGFSHENKRAMAWAYDLSVQSWSLAINRIEPNFEHAQNIIQSYGSENAVLWANSEMTSDQMSLVIASHLRALKCKPEWRHDFFTRKCTIAMGIGMVHGKKYDFRKLFMES